MPVGRVPKRGPARRKSCFKSVRRRGGTVFAAPLPAMASQRLASPHFECAHGKIRLMVFSREDEFTLRRLRDRRRALFTEISLARRRPFLVPPDARHARGTATPPRSCTTWGRAAPQPGEMCALVEKLVPRPRLIDREHERGPKGAGGIRRRDYDVSQYDGILNHAPSPVTFLEAIRHFVHGSAMRPRS